MLLSSSISSSHVKKKPAVIPNFKIPKDLKLMLDQKRHPKILTMTKIQNYYFNIINNLTNNNNNQIDILKNDYEKTISLGLFIEEYQNNLDLQEYNCDVKIKKLKFNNNNKDQVIYKIMLSKRIINDPIFQVNDKVQIYEKLKKTNNDFYTMTIFRIYKTHILAAVEVTNSFCEAFSERRSYKIKFVLNSYPYSCCHYTLKNIDMRYLEHRVYPNLMPINCKLKNYKISDFLWFNEKIGQNEEQKIAVENIVNMSSYPAPYIVYGPPGTGKTSTIVESIYQIWKNEENCYILICTPSNSAADTITERLIKYPLAKDVIRLYSLSKDESTVNNEIVKFSNILSRREKLEDLIKNKKIIICTLCYSTKLVLKNIKKFSYLFIDEASQATEPDTLIPFNLCWSQFCTNPLVHIVLSGDPQQLGPVVKSSIASPILRQSMMERLMLSRDIYKKDLVNNTYNEKYIIKLLNNYRSNKNIIKISNELFYDNELKYCASSESTKINWSALNNINFPLIFHGVKGKEKKISPSPSTYNSEEIDLIINYVKKLIGQKFNDLKVSEENIGIITPFSLQSEQIQLKLKKENFKNIEVGTIELYQGREKDIIILSAVRSKTFIDLNNRKHIGFLNNYKRFNVAITRAKSLLIVIGNPNVLKIDKNWFSLIKFCIDNKSYVGLPLYKNYLKKSKIYLDSEVISCKNNVNKIVTSIDLFNNNSNDENNNTSEILKNLNNLKIMCDLMMI